MTKAVGFLTQLHHIIFVVINLYLLILNLYDEKLAVAVDGIDFPIEGKRDVKLKFGKQNLIFTNVMYSSMLRKNLISAPKMDDKGVKFEGRKGKIEVTNKIGQPLFTTKLRDGIYYVFPKIPSKEIKHVKFKGPKNL